MKILIMVLALGVFGTSCSVGSSTNDDLNVALERIEELEAQIAEFKKNPPVTTTTPPVTTTTPWQFTMSMESASSAQECINEWGSIRESAQYHEIVLIPRLSDLSDTCQKALDYLELELLGTPLGHHENTGRVLKNVLQHIYFRRDYYGTLVVMAKLGMHPSCSSEDCIGDDLPEETWETFLDLNGAMPLYFESDFAPPGIFFGDLQDPNYVTPTLADTFVLISK
jgi:hypothetical protein